MNERKIHRTYLAIVRGITPESGTITAPIGRKEGSVLERQVDFGQGEYACTHYFRLAVKEIFPKNTFQGSLFHRMHSPLLLCGLTPAEPTRFVSI